MSEQAKATARKFFEEQDRLRGGPADELCAAGYTAVLGSFPAMDFDGHTAFAAALYASFPDLCHVIEEIVAEDDRVATRFRLLGTNTESFMGQPPTGKRIDVRCLALMHVSSGQVAELHGAFDQLGMMQQIGALPGH